MGRKKDSSMLFSMNPTDWVEAVSQRLEIFQPSAMVPVFAMGLVQWLVRSGALYNEDKADLNAIPGRHFGDHFAWDELKTVMGLFRFDLNDKRDRYGIIMGGIISLLLALRATFGVEGAFRFWCALFEACFTGVKIDFPDSSEPVATIRLVPYDESPGWDKYFGGFETWAMRTLENSVDETRAMRYWQQAIALPEGSYARRALRGFLDVVHGAPSDGAQGEPDYHVDGYGDVYESLLHKVAKSNRAILAEVPDEDPKGMAAYNSYWPGQIDLKKANAWAKKMTAAYGSEVMSKMPHWVLKSYPSSILDLMTPNQRYHYDRNGSLPGGEHSGIDLGVESGTDVLSAFGGKVIAVGTGQKPTPKAERGADFDPRGNFVIVRTEFKDKDGNVLGDISHEYYHLQDVSVKKGQTVKRGQLLGHVGNTGNSTGPHLHLSMYFNWRDYTGRSFRRVRLDPEKVLRNGVLSTLRDAGISPASGSPRPHLAVPLAILGTISNRGLYASPISAAVAARADQLTQTYLEAPEPTATGGEGQPGADVDGLSSSSTSATGEVFDKQVLDDAQKEAAKKFAVRALKTMGPAALKVALTGLFSATSIPAPVAAVIVNMLVNVVMASATGDPEQVIQTAYPHVAGYAGEHADEVMAIWPNIVAKLRELDRAQS